MRRFCSQSSNCTMSSDLRRKYGNSESSEQSMRSNLSTAPVPALFWQICWQSKPRPRTATLPPRPPSPTTSYPPVQNCNRKMYWLCDNILPLRLRRSERTLWCREGRSWPSPVFLPGQDRTWARFWQWWRRKLLNVSESWLGRW